MHEWHHLTSLMVFHVDCAAIRAIVTAIRTVSYAIPGCDHPFVRNVDLPPNPERNTRRRFSSTARIFSFETSQTSSVRKRKAVHVAQRRL